MVEPFCLFVADGEQKVGVLLGLVAHHFLEDDYGVVVGAVEDVADAEQVLQVCVVVLDLEGVDQGVDGVGQSIVFEVLIDLFNGGLDESVPFDLLLDSLDDVVDFLLVLAGRVVLPVDGFLEFEGFVMRTMGSVRRGNVLFAGIGCQPAVAVPLGGHLVLLGRFGVPAPIEDVLVLGEGPLVGRGQVVMVYLEVLVQVPPLLGGHVPRTPRLTFPHNSLA